MNVLPSKPVPMMQEFKNLDEHWERHAWCLEQKTKKQKKILSKQIPISHRMIDKLKARYIPGIRSNKATL